MEDLAVLWLPSDGTLPAASRTENTGCNWDGGHAALHLHLGQLRLGTESRLAEEIMQR